MEEVSTKIYEAMQDFVLPSVNEDGSPAGEVSYTAGVKYELPEVVAALAPEGALKEVVVDAPVVTESGSATLNPQPTESTKPEPTPAKPWVGSHSMTDR